MAITLTDWQQEAWIAEQLRHLGEGEHPPGSNITRWGAEYGMNGVAWCCEYQSMTAFDSLGFGVLTATTDKGAASCYAVEQWAKRMGWWVSPDQLAQRGDEVLFRWTPGDIVHHIGKVLEVHGIRDISTVEGNTGDKVQLHHRRGSTIAGYVRVPTVAAPAPPPHHPAPPAEKPLPAPILTHTFGHGLVNASKGADRYVVQYLETQMNQIMFKNGWTGDGSTYFKGRHSDGVWTNRHDLAVIWCKDVVDKDLHDHGKAPIFPTVAGTTEPNALVGPKTISYFTIEAAKP